jgi:effector-binding domain-containing protein
MVETAEYKVIKQNGEFEIRRYEKMIIVETESSRGSSFNKLFQYISGANKSKTKIDMTSPVISSEKIPMTSPVIDFSNSMAFVVPSKYSIETVPVPTDRSMMIRELPERYVATIRFKGFAWRDKVEKQTNKLLKWLLEENIQTLGEPFLMQYNPPFIPGFLRRNEVGVAISYQE